MHTHKNTIKSMPTLLYKYAACCSCHVRKERVEILRPEILCQLVHNTSLSPIHSKPNQAGYGLRRDLKSKYAHAV